MKNSKVIIPKIKLEELYLDKRVSTQKSLPAKKLQGTIKNKPQIPTKTTKDSESHESK